MTMTEAEYVAFSQTAKHVKWIIHFLHEAGFVKYISGKDADKSLQVYGDNQASLTLVGQPQINERSKHINIAYHFVHDLHEKGIIKADFIPMSQMIADALTKALLKDKFIQHQCLMGLIEVKE